MLNYIYRGHDEPVTLFELDRNRIKAGSMDSRFNNLVANNPAKLENGGRLIASSYILPITEN